VVGEAEPQAFTVKLPLLWWPSARRRDDLELPREQVVDRAGMGRTVESEALAQCLEGSGVLGGPQVEVAAEEQRRAPGPRRCRFGGAQDIGRGQVWPVVGRVQVGNAENSSFAEVDACKGHRPSLGPTVMDRQLPSLHDP
jgi:hypothetical protein